jgi:tetratricopeptide (TPR) repeat protein/DNA-binding Xre family transcriptional regulator
MGLLLPLKSLLLAILRLLKRKRVKELAATAGLTTKRIGGIERGTVKNVPAEEIELLLTSMECSEAEVVIVSACLEALADLDPQADAAEAAAQERFVAAVGRDLRRRMRAPGSVEPREYPMPHEVEPDRAEAREAWGMLREVKTLRELALAVRIGREHHRWALVERLCDESERAASKDAGRARDLAFTAVRIARHLPVREGRESWRRRLLSFAVAHLANALRVASELKRAERTLAAARRLWAAGQDPDQLLDPGRLHDLEASLRRDQRRFAESLRLLEDAAAVTRRPEHVSLKTASTLTVMGEYHRVLEILTEVAPRIASHPEARLRTVHRFNLAVVLSHVGRHREAARLLPGLRRMVAGDELDRIRFRWLEGRLAAGLGHIEAALKALADARSRFARRNLHYDVALSLLETAVLHLERGELAEVQRLAGELAPIFEHNGVHEEALKALRLFEEAVARQAATAELARRLLAWLFRAQYDPGLVFSLGQEPGVHLGMPDGSRMQPASALGAGSGAGPVEVIETRKLQI